MLIDDFDRGLSLLRRLKALGVRIAMDDFGTGYSSLTYLQAFPFDKIKIDRAFVLNLGRNAQSAAIIRAMIGLGHGLDISIVAEGVETQDQLTFLAHENCDQVQGYFLGKPPPIVALCRHCRPAGGGRGRAQDRLKDFPLEFVMPALVAGIHVFEASRRGKTWMAGKTVGLSSNPGVLSH